MNSMTFEGNFCENCVHEEVCALWISIEGVDASAYSRCDDNCKYFKRKEMADTMHIQLDTGVSPERMNGALTTVGTAFANVRITINTAAAALEELEEET